MSRRRSRPSGRGGGEGSPRAGAPVIFAETGGGRSSNETMDDLLRVTQDAVDAGMAVVLAASSAPCTPSTPPLSPPRSCLPLPSSLARRLRRILGIGKSKNSSASSSLNRRSSARSSRGDRASSEPTSTSGSALVAPPGTGSMQEPRTEQPAGAGGVQEPRMEQPARAGGVQEPRTEQPSGAGGVQEPRTEQPAGAGGVQEPRTEQLEAPPTRSELVEKIRSALAKVQVDSEVQAPFDEMQQAITGLMELTYGKAELSNLPELPHEFSTNWLYDDADSSDSRVMKDPIILASGYSVDGSWYQWSWSKNICPVSEEPLSHSATFPNDLLHDIINAWHLDHSLRSSTSTVETLPMVPSEEQIEGILRKFSEHSTLQEEALHDIEHLSKITKGEQPCLEKWPVLIQVLIDLQKNWKSTWTVKLEELRLTVILNLSVYRPNNEILARATQLPDALKKIADKLPRLSAHPVSHSAKLACIVANLSESEDFRKRILDIGGMEMLQNLLKIEDVVVRKEAVAAISVLCTDQEGKARAESCHVSDLLVECLTITDEALVLLVCLQKDPSAVDKLSDKIVGLVNIIMADQEAEPVTPKAFHSAISLVLEIVQQDVSKMDSVKNLKDFVKRLHELSSSGILPMQIILQLEKIISILAEMSSDPEQVQS